MNNAAYDNVPRWRQALGSGTLLTAVVAGFLLFLVIVDGTVEMTVAGIVAWQLCMVAGLVLSATIVKGGHDE